MNNKLTIKTKLLNYFGKLRYMTKLTKEQCKNISIYDFKKRGILKQKFKYGSINWTNRIKKAKDTAYYVFDKQEKYVAIYHKFIRPGNKEMLYKISITTTPCYYGKERYWFMCPNINNGASCNKRVAKLYLAPNSHYFICRHCLNLSYEIRNRNRRNFNNFTDEYLDLILLVEKLVKTTKIYYRKNKITKKFYKLLNKYNVFQHFKEIYDKRYSKYKQTKKFL